MNRQFEQRLRRLEEKLRQALEPKKAWLPKCLADGLRKKYNLPFDTEEQAMDSNRGALCCRAGSWKRVQHVDGSSGEPGEERGRGSYFISSEGSTGAGQPQQTVGSQPEAGPGRKGTDLAGQSGNAHCRPV